MGTHIFFLCCKRSKRLSPAQVWQASWSGCAAFSGGTRHCFALSRAKYQKNKTDQQRMFFQKPLYPSRLFRMFEGNLNPNGSHTEHLQRSPFHQPLRWQNRPIPQNDHETPTIGSWNVHNWFVQCNVWNRNDIIISNHSFFGGPIRTEFFQTYTNQTTRTDVFNTKNWQQQIEITITTALGSWLAVCENIMLNFRRQSMRPIYHFMWFMNTQAFGIENQKTRPWPTPKYKT